MEGMVCAPMEKGCLTGFPADIVNVRHLLGFSRIPIDSMCWLMVSIAFWCFVLWLVSKVKSSANGSVAMVVSPMVYPSFGLLVMALMMGLKTHMKIMGEIGSPWKTPLANLK